MNAYTHKIMKTVKYSIKTVNTICLPWCSIQKHHRVKALWNTSVFPVSLRRALGRVASSWSALTTAFYEYEIKPEKLYLPLLHFTSQSECKSTPSSLSWKSNLISAQPAFWVVLGSLPSTSVMLTTLVTFIFSKSHSPVGGLLSANFQGAFKDNPI